MTGINLFNTTLDNTISRVVLFFHNKEVWIDNDSTPTITEYKNNVPYFIELKYADVFHLYEYQLKNINIGAYEVGDNIITRTGILADSGDYIYGDKIYKIDKDKSTANSLFLTEPIESEFYTLYKATRIVRDQQYIYPIEQELKMRILRRGCCPEDLTIAQSLLSLFKADIDCKDFDSQKSLLDKLKSELNIRC